MKITHYTIDPEGGTLGTKSPSLWLYDDKGKSHVACYFTKPKWMTKKQFTRLMERVKLDIKEGEKLI